MADNDKPDDKPDDRTPAPLVLDADEAPLTPPPAESGTSAPEAADGDNGAPEPVEADATEGSTSDSPPTVGATTPVWWEWVSRHRKPVGIVAALVVVAVVATAVTVSLVTPGPKDVVQSYMDALQAGDTRAALDIVGEPEDDNRLHVLSADALADDWTVTAVVERHRADNEADVDVTITSGDTSEQGRFHLVHGDAGWTIESPFVRVDLVVGGIDQIELGGVREAVPGDAARNADVPLLLFPGAYDLYPSLTDHVTFDPATLVATPQSSSDQFDRITVGYTLTDDGTAAANETIAARVEECESMPDLTPDGCPFNAENDRAILGFSDVLDVTWAVTSPPKARFVPTPGGPPRLVLHTPGTVTLTGRGIPFEPEDAAPVPFTVTCEFGVDNLAVAVAVDGVTVNGAAGRPYAAEESTNCF